MKIKYICMLTLGTLYLSLNASSHNQTERWGCFIEITGDFVPDVETVSFKSEKECNDSCSSRCTKITGNKTDISD